MVSDSFDVVVCGGGPAGLAAAITAADRSLSVLVLEKRGFPPDKACGEGLLPPAVQALERLGALSYIGPTDCRRFRGIRFIQEDGSSAEALLPGGGGLGVRRTVLVDALSRRARDAGVIVRHGCAVRSVERTSDVARVHTESGAVSTRVVVAADGLHSPLRRAAGLERPRSRQRRYALRQHYRIRPWSDFVEVHADAMGEAVVTPVSEESVNVNFVWEKGELDQPTLETLASRFPLLGARLRNAPALSSVRGAGPMACGATRRSANRLVLIGDAAGFIDSISADGLSIAFNSALLFGHELPEAVARGATEPSFAGYERGQQRLFRTYWALTNGLLWIARHPRFRRSLIHVLGRYPFLSRTMMDGAMRMMLVTAPA